jgi:hypothetical protein
METCLASTTWQTSPSPTRKSGRSHAQLGSVNDTQAILVELVSGGVSVRRLPELFVFCAVGCPGTNVTNRRGIRWK